MRTAMRRDLTAALKAIDRVTVSALRSALAAIDNAEAPPAGEHVAGYAVGPGAAEVQRRQLTEAGLRTIVEAEVRERSVAASEYERAGRDDVAQHLRSEADVLGQYVSR
ncbi:MAG: GatB/YqeY domain-containing protein [Streptosporangiales bacterium]